MKRIATETEDSPAQLAARLAAQVAAQRAKPGGAWLPSFAYFLDNPQLLGAGKSAA